jgi:ATP-dependent 26S proteasome regulatory subunit
VVFELRRLDTGGLVHRYSTEGAALAFVRDVVRVAGHERAACLVLDEQDPQGNTRTVADGSDLVWRAVQDRAN